MVPLVGRPQGKGSPGWEQLGSHQAGSLKRTGGILYPEEHRAMLMIARAGKAFLEGAGEAWGQDSTCHSWGHEAHTKTESKACPALPSRAGWRRPSHSLRRRSGTSWGVARLPPQSTPAFKGQAGSWQPCSVRSQKSATCTHTCSSHVPNMLLCAPTITHAHRSHTLCTHTACCLCAPCVHTCSNELIYTPGHVHQCVLTHVRSLPHTLAATGTHNHRLMSPQDHTGYRVKTHM